MVISDVAVTFSLFVVGEVDEIVGAVAHADAVNSTSRISVNEERSIDCVMEPPVKDL